MSRVYVAIIWVSEGTQSKDRNRVKYGLTLVVPHLSYASRGRKGLFRLTVLKKAAFTKSCVGYILQFFFHFTVQFLLETFFAPVNM